MLSTDQPDRISVPFANAGVKRTIPVPSQIGITDGAASFTDGFPPKTFLPLTLGGVPPAGADFNGVLNAVTDIQRWQSGGGLFKYDAAFSAEVGGYPKGARLLSADASDIWISLTEDNITDPDAAGAGWISARTRGWVCPEDFLATGGANDTAAIQAMLDFAGPLKIWVRGSGKVYKVSTVHGVSGQRVLSLDLESVGPLSGGAISFQPVFEINGLTAAKTDMYFLECSMNGRRDLYPNINMGLGEDGGMHAWRVVADAAGGVSNIAWRDCKGINSATAGLCIHSPNPASGVGAATYPIKNISWEGGQLSGNREHGWFADAFDGLTVTGADCTNNGTDLNTTDPLTHGNRGARSGGFLFGSGFDIESYGPALVGSLWRNVYLDALDCRYCAMPSQLYNPIATNVAGYSPHVDIHIGNCRFDKGIAAGADRGPDTDFSFHALGNLTGTSYPYIGLTMPGCTFEGAAPRFNGVKRLTVTGGYVNATGVKAHVYNCINWEITINGSASALDIVPAMALPTFTKTQGSVAAVMNALTMVRTTSKVGGEILYHLNGNITGGANVDGDLIYTVVSPVAGMSITELNISVSAPIGTAVASASAVVGGTGTIFIDTVNSATAYFNIFMTLSPSA